MPGYRALPTRRASPAFFSTAILLGLLFSLQSCIRTVIDGRETATVINIEEKKKNRKLKWKSRSLNIFLERKGFARLRCCRHVVRNGDHFILTGDEILPTSNYRSDVINNSNSLVRLKVVILHTTYRAVCSCNLRLTIVSVAVVLFERVLWSCQLRRTNSTKYLGYRLSFL